MIQGATHATYRKLLAQVNSGSIKHREGRDHMNRTTYYLRRDSFLEWYDNWQAAAKINKKYDPLGKLSTTTS